ncbi:S1 RNA-binding domain-containing protein, partial [Myxococcota bacterium]|nr:S1 RNA-binding domain-containing protein [Myxococcota bacterium]
MNRKMLINGQRAEELRLAIIGDGVLEHYQVEKSEAGLQRANIYVGQVTSLQKNLNAAFVDYGSAKDGFLPAREVMHQVASAKPRQGEGSQNIEQLLQKKKPILVQVTNDAVGGKGAALTTNISLAGRYLVLTPFDSSRGISRKIEDEDERKV